MKKILLSIAIIGTLFSGCKKEEKATPKSKTELLCAHYWKMTAATIDPPLVINGTPINDFYAQLEACDKDNIVKYNSNNTVINDEGATKCDPASPQTTTGTWSFNSTETIITEDGESADLLELNETTLKMSVIDNIDGINYKFTITFNKN